LLAGGLLNALCGLAQFGQIWPALGGWVAAPMEARDAGVYGNLAQQNHFATHLALAMAAASYLYFSRRMPNQLQSGAHASIGKRLPLLAFAVICLLLFAALLLSGSRSSLLYVVWIGGLGLALLKRSGSSWPWRKIGMLALALLAVLTLALVLIFSLAGHGVPQIDRLKTILGGLGVRAYLWRHAWAMFCSHPLLGVGFDGFAWHLVQQLHDLKEPSQWGIDQYAHNLWLQLLAAAGVPGLLALAWPLGLWLRRQAAQPYQIQKFLPWAVLGILLIHSMLEQPLYFAYFLGIAALLIGMADPQAWQIGLRIRPLLLLICLLGLVQLVKTGREYDQLEGYFYSQRYRSDDPGEQHRVAHKLSQDSLLGPLVELAAPAEFVPESANISEKIRFNQRLRHFAPVAEIEYREAALLAQAGQTRQAMAQFERAAYAYPGQTKVYLPRFFALAQSDPANYAALADHAREFVMKMHGKLD
jgi:O-antigen ligase